MSTHEFNITEERVKDIALKFMELGKSEKLEPHELMVVISLVQQFLQDELGLAKMTVSKHEAAKKRGW